MRVNDAEITPGEATYLNVRIRPTNDSVYDILWSINIHWREALVLAEAIRQVAKQTGRTQERKT